MYLLKGKVNVDREKILEVMRKDIENVETNKITSSEIDDVLSGRTEDNAILKQMSAEADEVETELEKVIPPNVAKDVMNLLKKIHHLRTFPDIYRFMVSQKADSHDS